MGKIKVLSENVANKIAAGEVIERPASIVKELVENSLDAGAKSIEITVKNGGKSLIRVSDNGSGMTAEDAELSFLRHATSKIGSAEDLNHIASLGFRGEALASIAAVSRTTLQTRFRGEGTGTEIVFEGGIKKSVKPVSCREGTIIEVRDLFFNTPARRKFVKTDATEYGHILDAVSNLALAYPEVRFSLVSGEKTTLDLLPNQSLLERARIILGEEAGQHLIEMSEKVDGIEITGVIGKPHLSRANRSGQTYFINRRWIRSIGLSYALQDGYHGLLMHGQFAVGIIFIGVDAERVDVNVHPTKQEVRISKESEVKSLIKRAVAEALQKEGDLAPSIKSQPLGRSFTPSGREGAYTVPHNMFDADLQSEAPVKIADVPGGHSQYQPDDFVPISVRDRLNITKVLGQIHHTFIIAETEEGLLIIDQHAAHEKVMFETLVREMKSGNVKKQGLLMEETIKVHPKQEEILKESLPLLAKLGFEIEEFGGDTFVIRAYPAALENENPAECIKRFLEEKEDGKVSAGLENFEEDTAALIACKRRSVKAHDPLSLPAQQALVKRLAECENPFSCPHGRPTFFKHSFLELEKLFKRK